MKKKKQNPADQDIYEDYIKRFKRRSRRRQYVVLNRERKRLEDFIRNNPLRFAGILNRLPSLPPEVKIRLAALTLLFNNYHILRIESNSDSEVVKQWLDKQYNEIHGQMKLRVDYLHCKKLNIHTLTHVHLN